MNKNVYLKMILNDYYAGTLGENLKKFNKNNTPIELIEAVSEIKNYSMLNESIEDTDINEDLSKIKDILYENFNLIDKNLQNFELYKILDKNNINPTIENLNQLKEDIKNDEILLIKKDNVFLLESTSPKCLIEQLLNNNGYEINSENIQLFKKYFNNNKILFY